MRISLTNKPYLVVTMGDPAGIGPEVAIKALSRLPGIEDLATLIVIGDEDIIRGLARGLGVRKIKYAKCHSADDEVRPEEGVINILDPGPSLGSLSPGRPTQLSSLKTLRFLEKAVEIIKNVPEGTKKSLVTGPVNKAGIADIVPDFIGHTEYLQEAFSRHSVTMALVGKNFTVVPVTRHIPLKQVASKLSYELITGTIAHVIENIKVLSDSASPMIGVCALNPHCGEGGKMGKEEIDIILPAVQDAARRYANITGPVSSDVVFYKAVKGQIDIVIGMYHDQCLAPFKMVDFDGGVNTTLGLGFTRTSPDHGTAYDIAGRDIANPGSMEEAIKVALKMIS